ncbi:MAG: DUF934 domain-containing protein [Phenylobacterium sp.]|jgi:uncharacterized protein (DUF934 family)|uniref:DUF934 domain-containing protein n=1 Tax=Phenylobacterium sp. TaxID=1871053 RepID=UPI002A322243|nr:DUF934 domain-containing protein [Phenylobacterium sp.]MDD3837625.1 DUF934 domain-containing protein [Phenylobacterium sp.]MDX9998844.1 DUF934 domain-containing protein [Phenylobacterium sp.]
MPTYIKLTQDGLTTVEDPFTFVADDDQYIPPGDVILSLARFQTDGERLLSEGRAVGVRVTADETVESLAYDLPRLSVVALEFPKFRDGRQYSNGRLLRERYGYEGEVRAVGDVLREQAQFMLRCGIDAFEPADGSTPEAWAHAAGRFRHVYQRAADERVPAFVLRAERQ